MLEFTNNDIYTPITGDIVKSSGQNYGYLLALANGTTNSQSLIGVVQKASTPGYVGQVETKGLLTVNCTEEPTVGAALYLSSVTRGKATRVVVAGEIGIGACVSKSYTGSYWKADLEWSPVDGSAAQNQALYQGTAPAGGVRLSVVS